MKKSIPPFFLFFIFLVSTLHGQHDLSSGHYQFNSWSSNALAGTYPEHMSFYFLNTPNDPTAQTELSDLYDLPYNLTTSSRIRGLDQDGFSFINTANSQHHPQGDQLGAAVLDLNTSNRFNIQLTWTAKTIQTGGRIHALQLFYRSNPSENWTEALDNNANPIVYLTQSNNGNELNMDVWTLPSSLEDLPHVQLMWKYYEHTSSSQQGTRSQLAIKNIYISSEGFNDPIIAFESERPFAIQQSGLPLTDSFKIKGAHWSTGLSIQVAPPFEISFENDQNFQTSLSYHSLIEEDSVRIYIRGNGLANGWNEALITATCDQVNELFIYPWYFVESHLPDPFQVSDGHYLFKEWSSENAAGTFPDHMSFQMTSGDHYPSTSLPLIYDWNCDYNLTARSRFNGGEDWGILFLNTSSPQWDHCNVENISSNKYVGAVTLVANTEQVDSAVLSYYIMMFDQANVANKRKYAVQLQYRLSPYDTFVNYSSTNTYHPSYDVLNFDEHWVHLRLEESLLNQSFVQFRWLYFDEQPGFGAGLRPTYRLDEISLINLGIPLDDEEEEEDISIDERTLNQEFYIYPNPITNGQTLNFSEAWSGTIFNIEGKIIETLNEVKEWSVIHLPTGIYFLKSHDDQHVQKIHIIQ